MHEDSYALPTRLPLRAVARALTPASGEEVTCVSFRESMIIPGYDPPEPAEVPPSLADLSETNSAIALLSSDK